MHRALIPLVAGCVLATAVVRSADAPTLPVYVVLVSTIEDHLNDQPSLERIERILPAVERYRREYPQYGATWLLRVTGTVAERLAEVNYAGRIVTRIADARRAGIVEVGYDGTDEPTFVMRPRPNFRRATTPDDRWLARLDALEWFLAEGKGAVTGEPLADRTGGLRRTIDVLGPPVAVRGVTLEIGGDPELVHVLRRWGLAPVMPGFGENTTYPGRTLAGYRGGTGETSALLSPDDRTAPEAYWQDGLLTLSDFVGPDSRVAVARDGVAAVQKVLGGLNGSRMHIVQVRLGHPGVYIKPGFGERRYQSPLEFSYENPRSPTVPADALRSPDEAAAEYAREVEVLEWLVKEYFPAHPGSRFLSIGELQRMAGAATPDVSLQAAHDVAHALLDGVRQHPLYLPGFVRVADRYLSLADTFGLLVASLAQGQPAPPAAGGSGVVQLYGPRGLPAVDASTVGARIARADIEQACTALARGFASPAWTPVPLDAVPSSVRVGGRDLTAAQFLLAMADARVAARDDADVVVRQVLPLSLLGESFPGTRPQSDKGTTWTLKPARLRAPAPAPGTLQR